VIITNQHIVLNAYRRASRMMAEARAPHRQAGNSDQALNMYRQAARAFAAARQLDQAHEVSA
jgi:hypothetical protein